MNEGTQHPISIFDPIQELEHDQLGRFQFAKRLLKRVALPDCPSTLGLYGGWGVGKTSILNLMIALNKQEKIPVVEKTKLVYMDVWPYEVSGDLALPILVQIRNLLGELPSADYSTSWRRIVGVVAQAGADIFLRRAIGLELGDVKDYVDNLKTDQTNLRNLKTLVDDIRGAQESFDALVQLARKANQNRRLVFLIDNLDRCSPENVVRLLESVKNFLYASNCIWIFAMDSGVIASYIDRKYENTRMDGNSYLDKIIPEQYHIPPVSSRDMGKVEQFLSKAKPAAGQNLPKIDFHKIPQLPEVFVPRRLLKTARKYYEAYTTETQLGSANPDLAFTLILLYNTWPAFYERFSSEAPEHVRGILANFIDGEEKNPALIMIPKTLLDNRALTQYIKQRFINGQDLEAICKSLAVTMLWLREAGLP